MFGRLITAMVTPFDAEGNLDLDAASALATSLVDNGNDGLVVCGTTGESPTMTFDEKRDLLRAVVGGRADVIAGTGTYDTRETIHLSEMAAENGADGLLLVTPYYSRPPQAGLRAHFTAVANAVGLPIILYDIPGRTGRKIEHATLVELAAVENIMGVKDAAGDVGGTARLCAETGYTVWSGDDGLTLQMMSVGAYGVISVAGNVAPRHLADMIAAFTKGDVERAAQINASLLPLYDALFATSNPIPVKAGVGLLGHAVGVPRLPLIPANEAEISQVRAALEGLGVL
jgi:4-hydroxy-tetrahydrodipicolinate synthase